MPITQTHNEDVNRWAKGYGFYLDDLQADGSDESYFQLISLYLMGDQFFHIWHDWYHDETIVCDQRGLKAVFDSIDKETKEHGAKLSNKARELALQLDLTPSVRISDDVVEVAVTYFTKWGGFRRWEVTINRRPPHCILEQKHIDLVSYHVGYVM